MNTGRIISILAIIIMISLHSKGAVAQHSSIQEQDICAAKAERTFKADMAEIPDQSVVKDYSYSNHFNSKLNQCSLKEDSLISKGNSIEQSSFIVDAYEKRIYATYHEVLTPVEKNTVDMCEVEDASGKEIQCHSRKEFDDLAAMYMK